MNLEKHTVTELKEGVHKLSKDICKIINTFEDTYNYRTGMSVERDIETNEVSDITIALIDERLYG
jgi:hypothetical protein